MLKITDEDAMHHALDSPLDPTLKRVLTQRRDQLLEYGGYALGELAHFIIIEPADTIDDLEAAAGIPLITSPAFERITDHGSWLEAPTIVSDDGFGIVLLVPDNDTANPDLLSVLRSYLQGHNPIET